MAWRRAWIPAVAAGFVLFALVWWVCTPGVVEAVGGTGGTGLRDHVARWLGLWTHDPSYDWPFGDLGDAGERNAWESGLLIRVGTAVGVFVLGGVWTARVLPPNSRRRMTASLLVCWSWALIAGVVATAASVSRMDAGSGAGGASALVPMPDPGVAGRIGEGLPLIAAFGLAAAFVHVVVGVITATGTAAARDSTAPPEAGATPEPGDEDGGGDGRERSRRERPARLAATVAAALVTAGLLLGNNAPAHRAVGDLAFGGSYVAEPGPTAVRWLFLDAWQLPDGAPDREWLAPRLASVLLVVLLWLALRHTVGLLTRPGVVSVTVLTTCLLVPAAAVAYAMAAALAPGGTPLTLLTSFGSVAPAALTFGLGAGLPAGAAARLVAGGATAREGRAPAEG